MDFIADDIEARFPNMPVMRVNWVEARDYAEWAGLRLLSNAEWERAARGREGSLYPSGTPVPTGPGLLVYNKLKTLLGVPGSRLDFAYALMKATPLSLKHATPEGLHNMLGGVSEWTDTPYVQWRWIEEAMVSSDRIVKGGHWNQPKLGEVNLSYMGFLPLPSHSEFVGIRCGKSKRP